MSLSPEDLPSQVAFQVACQPCSLGNPVLFFGGERERRSLLLNQVEKRAKSQGYKVLRVDLLHSSRFFRKALLGKGAGSFEKRILSVDHLLLEEIQHVAGFWHIQRFLCSVWDRRIGANRQIVLSCHTRPAGIPRMDPKMGSRLESGFAIEMHRKKLLKDLPSVAERVSTCFGISADSLLRARGHRAALARAALVSLAFEAKFPSGEIASFLGGRSRSFIMHARKRSSRLVMEDSAYRIALGSIALDISPAPFANRETKDFEKATE